VSHEQIKNDEKDIKVTGTPFVRIYKYPAHAEGSGVFM
jgi:hypothetical protein